MESGQIQRQLYWGRAVGRCHLPPCVQQIYMPLLDGKRIALFANHSAMVKGEHLLELLLRNGEHVTVLYTPEHGIPYVREAIRAGKSAREIRSIWRRDVESFIEKSKPYLLYERKER